MLKNFFVCLNVEWLKAVVDGGGGCSHVPHRLKGLGDESRVERGGEWVLL